ILFKAPARLLRASVTSALIRVGMSTRGPVPELDSPFNYDTYLFDADGVLWRSNKAVPGAIPFLNELLEKGKGVYVVTNNSTKTTSEYVRKAVQLGFTKIKESNIISPNVVMADYFRRNPRFASKAVYTIASAGVLETLRKEIGVETIGDGPDPVAADSPLFIPSVDLSREVSAVVVGYDVHFSYTKIMKAANYLRDPACGFFITNEDATFPGPVGLVLPGTGCITSSIRTCVSPRMPVVFGKPGEELERYVKTRLALDPAKTIVFGDRLDTDISFGHRLGATTCWMRTGVHSEEDVQRAISSKESHLVPDLTFSFEQFYGG
ncbi:hypothetical protein PMAYCL1PPCAC_28490, partial [Pristionchus mayeri]